MELESIAAEVSDLISQSDSNSAVSSMIITYDDVIQAVSRLKPGTFDGLNVLSSNHFLSAADTLCSLSSLVHCNDTVPRDFMISSILPIPKNKRASVANSDNYRGIALSSVLPCKYDICCVLRSNSLVLSVKVLLTCVALC